MNEGIYYSDYLQLEKILGAQTLESTKEGREMAHDEMLFIVIHQTYELWFKQILHEVKSVIDIMAQPNISDNSPDLFKAVHRMKRAVTIMQVLVHQVDILETMTALDFLDFRNMLRPASGFQSIQFKVLEASLGLKMEQRHGKQYYTSQLRADDKKAIEDLEKERPLIDLVNDWLERMPFFDETKYWDGWEKDGRNHPFWKKYRDTYEQSLVEGEKFNLARFD